MVSLGASVTAAMVIVQFLEVGLNTIVKAAITNGMSDFVFVVYSNLLAFCLLLPSTFLYHKKRAPPPIPTSIICRVFLLSCLSTSVQTLNYIGIGYSSPTLASAMVDLVPAFTFILALVSRMEILNLKLHSSQAKIIGTVISIAGALIVTLYKGMPLNRSHSLPNTVLGGSVTSLSRQSNWMLGGFLLATSSFCLSVLFIVQTWIIKTYPQELIVTTFGCGFVVILSAIVGLIAERDPKAWILKPDMELVAMVYSAIVISMRSVVAAWACRKKGPVFVAMFNPLGIAIAIAMGIVFLGDALYLGSMIGAVTIAIGFYAVMWAQAQEEKLVNEKNFGSSSASPLLPNQCMD